ncbi:MAG: protein kinase [Deltaproteobacteria bacterium]|nr:protein kinase [Deltaproteobacteria bacterium]MBW1929813.1 protein kinase [Deltaproteobacteria bacterium]MBW2127114.1 protein kinase [Deltaproteobacteria bacterium]
MDAVEFGKYLLLEQVGVGRIGQVWKARVMGVKGLEKFLAIKRLLPHLTPEKGVVELFMEVGVLLVQLQHENIVRTYDFGSVEGTPYLAMEFVLGKDLAQLMRGLRERGQALGMEEALYIMIELCKALDFAHKFTSSERLGRPLVHAGIRPQNVLITQDGRIKLSDFCVSRVLFEGLEDKERVLEKTLPYVAPELARGELIDQRTDIFCAGVVLLELVTGKSWIEGSPTEVLARIRSEDLDTTKSIPEDLAPSLQEILYRALASAPSDRYASAQEMLSDLKAYGQEIGAQSEEVSLARYLDSLFGEELTRAKALAQGTEWQEETVSFDSEMQPSVEEPETGTEGGGPKKKLLLFIASGVAVILVILLLVFWPGSKKVEKASPTAPEYAQGVSQEGLEKTGQAPTGQVGVETTSVAEQETASPGQVEGQKVAPQEQVAPTQESQTSPEFERMKGRIDEGLHALAEERYADAINIFEAILKEAPSLNQDLAAPYAKALEGEGLRLEEKQPRRAKKLLVRAVQLNPESVEANFHLGLLYVESKNYTKAIERYQRVTALDPQYADAYFNLGYVYAITKKYDKAEQMYERVVALAPPYLDEALFNLAMIQRRLGKKDSCIENLKRAVIVNPDNKLAKRYLKRLAGE